MDTDSLARWYRLCEYLAFGRALERARFAFLADLAGVRRVLVLGEGDGRALAQMVRAAPLADFVVVESSAAMIALAEERIEREPRVQFRHEDVRTASFNKAHFDAVVTFFFLDCFNERELAEDIVPRIKQALVPGGIWLFADFHIPDQGWRRLHAGIWIGVMYRFFRVTTGLSTRRLAPLDAILRAAGLERRKQLSQRWGLIQSASLGIG